MTKEIDLPYTDWRNIAKVDPFGRAQRPEAEQIDNLLVTQVAKTEGLPSPVLNAEAKTLFGKDFLGKETIETVFRTIVPEDDVPGIPFSRQELERAKQLDHFLVLRLSHFPDGKPITMRNLVAMPWLGTDEDPLLDYDPNFQEYWFERDQFFVEETPRLGWALVAKKPIQNLENKRCFEQSLMIGEYCDNFYWGIGVPNPYDNAFAKLSDQEYEIQDLLKSETTKSEAGVRLANSDFNRMTRRLAVEVLYDTALYRAHHNDRLLQYYADHTLSLPGEPTDSFISLEPKFEDDTKWTLKIRALGVDRYDRNTSVIPSLQEPTLV